MLQEIDDTLPLAALLAQAPSHGVTFHWLGQAGFLVEMAGLRLLIDPYLSDSLAEKYRGTARPHDRMMPPPVLPQECRCTALLLCSHAHTDHMDAATLMPLLAANPQARLVVPRAVAAEAVRRSGRPAEQIDTIEAGETLALSPAVTLTATRAAHETLERDADGNHRFLGYLLTGGGIRLWHSGDCIPYAGLEEEVAALAPDLALLPVNGRRKELSDNGVAGNFSLDEAITLAGAVGARHMVAHHYGMFAFNTADPAAIDAAVANTPSPVIHRARLRVTYRVAHAAAASLGEVGYPA